MGLKIIDGTPTAISKFLGEEEKKMKYKLITTEERPEITIDESIKEDFKKIMGWSEEEFKIRTVEVQEK